LCIKILGAQNKNVTPKTKTVIMLKIKDVNQIQIINKLGQQLTEICTEGLSPNQLPRDMSSKDNNGGKYLIILKASRFSKKNVNKTMSCKRR
jgi:hypothetical protein